MTPKNKLAFQITKTANFYQRAIDADFLETYISCFSESDFETVAELLKNAPAHYKFFPMPAELKEKVKKTIVVGDDFFK